MRKDMTSVLFQRSASKRAILRHRFKLSCQMAPPDKSRPEKIQQMDFRLGEEPENCRVLHYLSARVSKDSCWVTAEVVVGEVSAAEKNDVLETHLDSVPAREPMRKRSSYNGKELLLNLSVLRRFLSSRVGRQWSDTLGEIRRSSDRRSFQGHILAESVSSIVVTNVKLVTGEPYDVEFACPLANSPERFRFFVDPATGILKRLPRAPKSARRAPVQRPEQIDIDARSKLVLVGGLWYVTGFQPIPTMAEVARNFGGVVPKDIILGQEAVNDPSRNYRSWPNKLSNFTVDSLRQAWGDTIYAVSKQQANRRQLRRYGVSERAV